MRIRRKHIRALTEKLLADNGVESAPVPVERLARSEGLTLRLESLKSDLSGFLFKRDASAVIGVNAGHAPVRQRFTIAHELGHHFLHIEESLRVDRTVQAKLRGPTAGEGTDADEVEANLFAAELLMPAKFLQRDIEELGSVDILDEGALARLAKKYRVSAQAMMYRLVNLGYVEG